MISIGITGQTGFIGTHLFNFFGLQKEAVTRIPFADAYFDSPAALEAFVSQCDVIIHLAALNRHNHPQTIYDTNILLVHKLIAALDSTGSKPHLLFASSTQEERDNAFGKSKREGRELLAAWAEKNNTPFTGLVIPNVFGPFGQPYYNSVVATFCHQVTHGEQPKIEIDAELKLIYIGELVQVVWEEISGQQSAISGQRSAVSDQRSAVSGKRSVGSGQRSAVSGQQEVISGQRSADSNQQAAYSRQREVGSSQPSAVSSQQSPIIPQNPLLPRPSSLVPCPFLPVSHTAEKKVTELLQQINRFKTEYFDNGLFPELHDAFERNLFNTFRCYMDIAGYYPVKLKMNTDDRGTFVETIKTGLGGQVSFSTTKPGITRGNHFHTRKIERFAVIKGRARIQLRRIGTSDVLNFDLDGNDPAYVDMPIWYTHNITNTGNEDLYTIFWINEFYDANEPDTYYETV